jgi:hypothetical protein
MLTLTHGRFIKGFVGKGVRFGGSATSELSDVKRFIALFS